MNFSNFHFFSVKEPKKEREITTPKFPFFEDSFSEFPEVKEEYDLAPDFQRINISGEDTSGVDLYLLLKNVSFH